MINPHKFQAILLDKENTMKDKIWGVHIESKLNFNWHVDIISKFASNQLNALIQLNCCLGLDKRFALVKNFVS